MADVNPHIDATARSLRNEIEDIERNLAAAQRLLAQKQEALKSIESLGLHTPEPKVAPAKTEKPAK